MKLIYSEHVGHVMRLLLAKTMLPNLAPLCASVCCIACDRALSKDPGDANIKLDGENINTQCLNLSLGPT